MPLIRAFMGNKGDVAYSRNEKRERGEDNLLSSGERTAPTRTTTVRCVCRLSKEKDPKTFHADDSDLARSRGGENI